MPRMKQLGLYLPPAKKITEREKVTSSTRTKAATIHYS